VVESVNAPRKSEPKHPDRRSWADWLKEEDVGVDRLNDQCKDREFRTARTNDLNFAQGRDGKIYPVSPKARRKATCILDQDR
jgi:hypothetical protein